jgi:hypothetical protein
MIGVGSSLLLGVSAGLFLIWWKHPERFVEPKDLTKEFVESYRALRAGGGVDPDTAKKMDELVIQGVFLAYDHAFNLGAKLLREFSNAVHESQGRRKGKEANLAGKWTGEVNNHHQVVTIIHDASDLLLEGYVTDADGKDLYAFKGYGWVCLGILVFSWQIFSVKGNNMKGINIMKIVDEGNTLRVLDTLNDRELQPLG